MVPKAVTTLDLEMADIYGFNLSGVCERLCSDFKVETEQKRPQLIRRESGCSRSRERKTENFAEMSAPTDTAEIRRRKYANDLPATLFYRHKCDANASKIASASEACCSFCRAREIQGSGRKVGQVNTRQL